MPKATVSTEAVRRELKSCEGGFVEIKRLPYGLWLKRQEMAIEMKVAQQQKSSEMDISMMQERVAVFEFGECIVNHNLEDDNGDSLNFKMPVALRLLDPKIGTEISTYISELHEFDPKD